jgi:hypothetical protein
VNAIERCGCGGGGGGEGAVLWALNEGAEAGWRKRCHH